jgi:putative membrane protein
LFRFNLDPVLIGVLVGLAGLHVIAARRNGPVGAQRYAAAGWLVTAAALISPLCALSVSLFSARVAQHMVLVLIGAPLIALAWPLAPAGVMRKRRSGKLWASGTAFFVALWFWHMPVPYDATFGSTWVYWLMHATLFGSSILLWRELLHPPPTGLVETVTVGALTSMQMGLLGAVLTFAAHPLFLWHLTTTTGWGLTPLRDQQLGGIFMWVPGIALFLWAAVRSLGRLWNHIEGVRQA